MLNIPSYVEDIAYRYKMPKMILKIEGKGNGIKTNIVNLVEVAKSLRVPTAYPLKFMGAQFGAIVEYKPKQNQLSIINGARTYGEMLKVLDKFIEKFILCRKCNIPETKISIKKGLLYGDCRACGASELIENAHRLVAYIIKNPPKDVSEFKDDEKQDGKKGKGGKKGGKKGKKGPTATEEEAKDIQKDGGSTSKKEKENEDAADDQGVGELQELTHQSAQINDAIERLQQKINASHDDLKTQFRNLQVSLGFEQDLKYHIALHAFFKSLPSLIKTFKSYSAIFKFWIANDTTKSNDSSQYSGQLLFMLALQHFCCVTNVSNIEKFGATIGKLLYDLEILSQQFFLKWHAREIKLPRKNSLYSKDGSKKMRAVMVDFITWLKQAEEDQDQDEGQQEQEDEQQGDASEQKKDIQNEEQMKKAQQQKLIQLQLEQQNQQIAPQSGDDKDQEDISKDNNIQSKRDILAVEVDDDFDIDDI